MSSPGGAYLPPIVTELRGDNSDLLRAFSEAKAAQEAFEKSVDNMAGTTRTSTRKAGRDVDDFSDLVVSRMHAGETAVSVLRREMARLESDVTAMRRRMASEGADNGLWVEFRKANDELSRMRALAQKVAPDLLTAGRKGGQGFFGAFMEGVAAISGAWMPILIGAVVLASPAIAALIGSAVSVGIGLGFAGIGVLLAALLLPKIKAQFLNIGRNFKRAFTFAISGGFDDGLRKALNGFNRAIPLFGAQLRRIFDALAPALVPLSNALIDGLQGFLAEMMQIIPQIMPALLQFIQTIPDVMNAVAEFLAEITKNGPALSRFITDAANAIANFLYGAGKVISWLESAYLWVVKLDDAFPIIGWNRQLEGLGIAIEAVKNFFVSLWQTIVDAAKAVGHWFADIGRKIWAFLVSAGEAVARWFTNTVEWFKKLPGRVIGFLASMPGRVQAVVSDMAHKALYWVGWLVGKWFLFITEAPGKIVAGVAAAWAWIQTKFQQGVDGAIAFLRAFPAKAGEYLTALWSTIVSWVTRIWTSVTDWFARTKMSMIEHIVSAVESVKKWFASLPEKASGGLSSFKDRVFKFFSGAKDWLIEAGKDIVRGVISGIEGAWDWAVGKVKSFGGSLAKGFKDALKIGSPSKVFARMGDWSAIGYVKGWARSLRSAIRKTASPVLSIANPPGGPPAPPGPPPGPGTGGAGGSVPLHAELNIDGQRFATVTTTAYQRRAFRSGPTGVGFAADGIM